MRTIKATLERVLKMIIMPNSPILPWVVRHGVFLLNRYAVRTVGRTPYEELHMTRYCSPLLQVGESTLARRITGDKGKLASKWEGGWADLPSRTSTWWAARLV